MNDPSAGYLKLQEDLQLTREKYDLAIETVGSSIPDEFMLSEAVDVLIDYLFDTTDTQYHEEQ